MNPRRGAGRATRAGLVALTTALCVVSSAQLVAQTPPDTIKAPLASFESPPDLEITPRLRFDREAILASGAMYLTDLLDRVPGVTSFRSGWLAGVHTAAYRGDFRRIRIFVDGIEVDAIDPGSGGVPDHVELPLWTLDAIEIERTPGEVRVWCHTAKVRRTTPYTRVDILTGDLNTNGFRGLFARRFSNGLALQVAGQHQTTQRGRVGFGSTGQPTESGDGDQQAYNGRIGWARGRFSVDAYGTAINRRRDVTSARPTFADLPRYEGARQDGYVRAAYGDTADGLWTQVMVSTLRSRLSDVPTAIDDGDGGIDSARTDLTRSRAQTLLGAGWRGAGLRLSVVDRVRGIAGSYHHAPAARASYTAGFLTTGVYAERSGADSTNRGDAFARLQPLPWMAITVTQSARVPDDSTFRPTENATRLEGALRLLGRWVGGGVIQHGATAAATPTLLQAFPSDLQVPRSLGVTASAHGPVYRDLGFDVQFLRWDRAAFSRPQMQVHSQLRLASRWLSRFPRGDFGIDARLTHELRDPVSFYYGATIDGNPIIGSTARTQLLNASLEIRIQQASLFYQYRNLTGVAYEQVPGITMPPAVQLYGVRWEFWN